MAVAQITSLLAGLLLLVGLVVGLAPHRLVGLYALVPAESAVAMGAVQGGVGLCLFAARLLHGDRRWLAPFCAVVVMTWGWTALWLMNVAPALALADAGVAFGALLLPFIREPIKPRADLGEVLAGGIAGVAGAVMLLPIELPGGAVLVRDRIPLGITVLVVGLGVATGRLLGVPRWARRLLGCLLGGMALMQVVSILALGYWGAAIPPLGLGILAAVSCWKDELPTMRGPAGLYNRAAVVLGLSLGGVAFAIALLASSIAGAIASPTTVAALATGRDVLLLCVVLVFAAAAALSIAVGRRLRTEMEVFGGALSTIARGNYDEPLPPRRGDERDVVIEAFDAMRGQVRRQLDHLQSYSDRLVHLHHATLRLSGLTDEQSAAKSGLAEAIGLLDADAGRLWLQTGTRGAFDLVATQGSPTVMEPPPIEVATLHHRCVAAPLAVSPHEIFGVLVVERIAEGAPAFTRHELRQLEFLTDGVAGAIQSARLFVRVSRLEAHRQTEKLKADFLASVSHELRTPLSIVHGYAELLRDRDFPPDQMRLIGADVFRASTALTRMVGDLLDFARQESGDLQIEMLEIQVGQVVDEGVATIKQHVDLRLVVDIPDDVPSLWADPARVRQAVAQLVSNAVKYGPENGTVRVQVTHNDQFVCIAVEDDGAGVPIAEREKIFERFYRAEAHANSTLRGVGLGLSLVKEVAESHGGEAGVEQRPGGGCTFWFTLARSVRPAVKGG